MSVTEPSISITIVFCLSLYRKLNYPKFCELYHKKTYKIYERYLSIEESMKIVIPRCSHFELIHRAKYFAN